MTPVTGNAAGETEANGSDVHCANKHEDNMIEGRDAQDGTSPGDAAMEEDSNECDELLQRFATFTESMVAKVRKNTEIRHALQRFLDQREKLKTDATLASALHCFGRYSGLSSLGKRPRMVGTKSIGVQPTAIARRRMACGGKRSLQTGRPTKYAATKEHGYTLLKKKKSVTSAQHLPTHHQLAPHNLAECVSRNVTLGKTHSRK